MNLRATLVSAACLVPCLAACGSSPSATERPAAAHGALPAGAIQHIMVIDIENESFSATFGNPRSYLSQTLMPQGELLSNYYAIGHVSLDNYIAQVSGQGPVYATNSDCMGTTGQGAYDDVTPGTPDPNRTTYPGQVDGQGCVYPAGVPTIGNQLDAAYPSTTDRNWRVYVQDMGADAARDGGSPDPLGGTDCAHPSQTGGVGVDVTQNAEGPNATGTQVHSATVDQYAARHDPFIYFHSVTDNSKACNRDVVPLGQVTLGSNGSADHFTGHLSRDLATAATTPRFSFVVPNLCNDGHDAKCAGSNTNGTTIGGLSAANLWLAHWMTLILDSPAYRAGHMLVVITADEGGLSDTAAGDNETPGPGNANPGYSPFLNTPITAFGGRTYYQLLGVTGLSPNVPPPAGTMPGGGRIGALLLNRLYIHPGTTKAAGSYNHYSALRSYEDLLGITSGGSDGHGHLGFASTATSFGSDIFTLPGSANS